MSLDDERLATLVIARIATNKKPEKPDKVAAALERFAPSSTSAAQWREIIAGVMASHGDAADVDELERRLGARVTRWAQLVDRVLPGIALGLTADAKALAKLDSRDAWAAAIAASSLGLWSDGPPPSLPALCDALAWRELGLAGKPKRCPPEVRALFVQKQLGSEPGSPERQVRLLAAREVGAVRTEGRPLRDALVRRWLAGSSTTVASFTDDVRSITARARDGVFGDHKVFISSAWRDLSKLAAWSDLTLDDFKRRVLDAHRTGAIELARADYVAAMDPTLVAASETVTDGASFHFIVREAS